MPQTPQYPLQLVFTNSHQPGMQDGDYRITVQQALSFDGHTDALAPSDAGRYLYLSVAGPRFSFDPTLVKSAFPPDKGIGRYSNVLPHIVLNRSTLPWERPIDGTPTGTSWLALLVLTGDEINEYNITPQTVSVGSLMHGSTNPNFPAFALETAQSESDQTTVIDVPLGVLRRGLPPLDDHQRLVHIRELMMNNQPISAGEEDLFPIAVGCRLPAYQSNAEGCEVTVHLVSMEGRADLFNLLGSSDLNDPSLYRLVTLWSWTYTTLPNDKTFADYLTEAAQNHSPDNPQNRLVAPSVATGTQGAALANDLLATGFIPLPHQTRQGNQLISWYRGPFITGTSSNPPSLSEFTGLRSPDQLTRYFSQVGMLDVSYASAWQLAQLLTLQNTSVSTALYNWKRATALIEADPPDSSLPLPLRRPPPMPTSVTAWLDDLALFKHVPFNYLVPAESMLPAESIRFFVIDPLWRAALMDGAFSIGRVLSSDAERDLSHLAPLQQNFSVGTVSGFLLRSHVVEGWPHLQVEGYSSIPQDAQAERFATPLPILRMERLAPDLLLCLFDGNLQTLDLHEVPETIHFGLSYEANPHSVSENGLSGWYKAYRDILNAEEQTPVVDASPYLTPTSGRLDITGLANALQSLADVNDPNAVRDGASQSWWVAFQMIEGVQQVRLMSVPEVVLVMIA